MSGRMLQKSVRKFGGVLGNMCVTQRAYTLSHMGFVRGLWGAVICCEKSAVVCQNDVERGGYGNVSGFRRMHVNGRGRRRREAVAFCQNAREFGMLGGRGRTAMSCRILQKSVRNCGWGTPVIYFTAQGLRSIVGPFRVTGSK